ncbi:MAG TPA: cell division ATP-binding protein FtsE [Nitrosomonas nitrosa]|jgi:cell division transport system ATP-binding protein|uniref:Cell division ATP-binding protein FtsE n=1 Tax=Nitrosomonas nitrosa TaxID=52442 RepID=A0A1I4QLA9_9PROT|nr:cell division ATP-binding protein FtsE [Nitrosomonas nitrosa]PTQ98344.1 cell division ATP-binding protein FtsE [Nitrosomonas nitrosa]CAE6491779.1 transporter subunit: ATP-binding component of ABC superfamily [Nitrosomonas nitrosa]SFM40500.1 cell division ATP-binding protein FtsE [Nitrosomonas nitrosa]HBZ31292.1 cell division ATP-binding protein FtsE [Nitrosomonas nitrosa]HNP51532.1 cell division ATP-binding protein FtsE [Nitrosomonas nitrosa]
MISFKNVYKRYPDGFEALKNVAFTIDAGELVYLTGHSGAGKSTLLKLIAAIERPTSGHITVSEQNVNALKKSTIPFLRRSLGIIFQDQKILYDRSVFANVMLPLQIRGFEKKISAARVRAALDKVGLLAKETANPITLSGGEKQRLCIARAVVHRPSILIADEPTANLDVDYAQSIMEVFRSFQQVGVTVLIATHDVTLLNDTRYRTLTLNQGKLIS